MKADRCGTYTQQIMFRQGYLTSKQRQEAGRFGQKCSNCSGMIQYVDSLKPRCYLGQFIVTPNATCDKWMGVKS